MAGQDGWAVGDHSVQCRGTLICSPFNCWRPQRPMPRDSCTLSNCRRPQRPVPGDSHLFTVQLSETIAFSAAELSSAHRPTVGYHSVQCRVTIICSPSNCRRPQRLVPGDSHLFTVQLSETIAFSAAELSSAHRPTVGDHSVQCRGTLICSPSNCRLCGGGARAIVRSVPAGRPP